MTAGGNSGARPAHGRCTVPRVQLLDEIDEGLDREGIVVLKAPWGYGKTMLLRECAQRAREMSVRPVASVEFASPEVMGFLEGNDAELVRALMGTPRKDGASGEPGVAVEAGQAAGMASLQVTRRKGRARQRALQDAPERYACRASRAVWLHIRAAAGAWCRGLESSTDVQGQRQCAPLVLIDDLPPLDAAASADFCAAVCFWASRGARVVVACTPGAAPGPGLLRRALVLGSDFLGVGIEEVGMWRRWLAVASDLDVGGLTNGVPMLVSACARVHTADPLLDKSYQNSCERLLCHALAEPLARPALTVVRAMVILGQGRLSELGAVGASCDRAFLEQLSEGYPLFGIDLARGRFSCPAMAVRAGYSSVRMCVEDDADLAVRCCEALMARGDDARAADVLGFMPAAQRCALLEAHPAQLADVVDVDVALACVEGAAARREDLPCGLQAMADFLELCRGGASLRQCCGFAAPIHEVLDFWYRFAGFACPEGAPAEVSDLVSRLGQAGLLGDADGVVAGLEELGEELARAGVEELPAAVLRCHAVACAVLAGCSARGRTWLAPHAQHLRSRRTRAQVPDGIADALTSAALALAAYAEELPSSGAQAFSDIEAVRVSRRYLEDRQIVFGVYFCAAAEALMLVGTGDEARADALLDESLRHWTGVGSWLGQAYARLGKAQCALVQNRPAQGRGHAAIALGIGQRLRFARLESTARLLLSVSLLRCHDLREIGEHELATQAQLSAQRGEAQASVVLCSAVLHAFHGELGLASSELEDLSLAAGPADLRLGGLVTRALGADKAAFLECLPDSLLREHGAIREARRRKRSQEALQGDSDWERGPGAALGRGLAVNVLGTMGGQLNGRALGERDWGRAKGLLLVGVLALSPSGRMPRADLAEILFDSPQQSRRISSLSTVLSSLRDALGQTGGGPEYIVGGMGTLGLNPALVSTDVSRFEQAASQLLVRQGEMTLRETTQACDELIRLFGMGPDPRLAQLGGAVAKRVAQLCDSFADCMLCGADTCFARGEFDMSLGYAKHASMAAPERADVAYAHDMALRAKARKGDAGRVGCEACAPLQGRAVC